VATGVGCDGCPPLPDLLARYEKAGARHGVPGGFNAKQLGKGDLIPNAELAGQPSSCGSGSVTRRDTFSY